MIPGQRPFFYSSLLFLSFLSSFLDHICLSQSHIERATSSSYALGIYDGFRHGSRQDKGHTHDQAFKAYHRERLIFGSSECEVFAIFYCVFAFPLYS